MGRRWTLFLLVLMAVLLNADNLVLSPNIDAVEKELRLTDVDIGNISALFTIVGAVVSLLWGYLGDRGSRKLLFALSIFIGEVPCLLTAWAGTAAQFYWLRVLTGIGVGASFPIAYSLVADLFDEKERGRATAYISAAIGFGSVVGALVGGYVGAAAGWRLPFAVVAVPNFLLAAVFWFTVKEPARGMSEEAFKALVAEGYVYPRKIRLSDYRRLVSIPTNVFLFLQGIAGTVPWGAIPLFLVTYLMREKGFSQEAATTIFFVFGLGNIIGTLAGGVVGGSLFWRAPRLVPIFAATTTIVGAGLAAAVFAAPGLGAGPGGFWVLVGFGLVTAVTVSLTGPNSKMMLMNVNVPENRGAIFSIFNLTDSVGTGVGRAISGWLAGLFGMGAALTISALFWLPCALFLVMLVGRFPRDVARLHAKMRAMAAESDASASPAVP